MCTTCYRVTLHLCLYSISSPHRAIVPRPLRNGLPTPISWGRSLWAARRSHCCQPALPLALVLPLPCPVRKGVLAPISWVNTLAGQQGARRSHWCPPAFALTLPSPSSSVLRCEQKLSPCNNGTNDAVKSALLAYRRAHRPAAPCKHIRAHRVLHTSYSSSHPAALVCITSFHSLRSTA